MHSPVPYPQGLPAAAAAGPHWPTWADRPAALPALIAALTLLHLLLAAVLPLLPQEAYYWTWSRHLDSGYFDHPPLVAWGIAATTALFGSTVFGIKLAAVLWSLGWNLLWARLVLDLYGDRRLAVGSLLALNLSLLYAAYGLGPTPDGPLLFGWLGTLWAVWRAGQTRQRRWWLWAGLFAGLALLGKYSAVLLAPVVLLALAGVPTWRHWLRSPWPYGAALLALALFSPVLLWNAEHGWASFAFQGSRRVGQMHSFKPQFLLLLLATQALLLTPWLFGLSLQALGRGLRELLARRADAATVLLLCSALVPLLVFGAASLRSHVKINWLLPAWWSLVVLGLQPLLRQQPWPRRRLAWGLGSTAAMFVLAAALALVHDLPMLHGMNSWSGWAEAAQHVDRLQRADRAAGVRSFVFAPTYKSSALLRYHLPGQPRTYAQDIYGAPALQFDHFPLDENLKGATGYLVLSDQAQSQLDLQRVAPHFATLQKVDDLQVEAFGRVTRRITIYRGTLYKGHPRLNPAQAAGGTAAPSAADDE